MPVRVEPTEDGEHLRIVWADGHVSEYEPRTLRLNCRCAGCIDEFTGRPILDPARVPAKIHPTAIHYVGRYALQFLPEQGGIALTGLGTKRHAVRPDVEDGGRLVEADVPVGADSEDL